jgi:hypothetical protein
VANAVFHGKADQATVTIVLDAVASDILHVEVTSNGPVVIESERRGLDPVVEPGDQRAGEPPGGSPAGGWRVISAAWSKTHLRHWSPRWSTYDFTRRSALRISSCNAVRPQRARPLSMRPGHNLAKSRQNTQIGGLDDLAWSAPHGYPRQAAFGAD